jgi:membrane-bound serine protease (ClpP class)
MQSNLNNTPNCHPMRLPGLRLAGLLAGAILVMLVTLTDAVAKRAVVLEIDGAVGPAVADYVVSEIGSMKSTDTGVIVLRLDTPGGLDTSMRAIIRAILASPIPVAIYVAPGGARAASAGTYIVYAGAIAAMAPGTNLGAATPIQVGKLPSPPAGQPEKPAAGDVGARQEQDTETRKLVNDAVAYIRSLAELHGRNAEWAAEAVRGAASLSALEAQKLQVIDVIASDVPDLLRKIDGRTAIVAGKTERLATAELEVVTMHPDWRTGLLAVIANPNIAYLLMLLGIFGLVLEMMSPGAILPGVIGGISLLTALFALNMLPINYAGAALVLLGLALMAAEAFIGSFGVIGAGGIVAFVIGSIIMFRPDATGSGLSLPLVAATTIVAAGFLILALSLLLRARRKRVITGREAMIGAEGDTVEWRGSEGRIRVKGEIWRAQAGRSMQPGDPVRVVAREGLILTVEPL